MNCERNANDAADRPGEPCNACAFVRASFEGPSALDLIELDGASNRGIDDIRYLREAVGVHADGRRRRAQGVPDRRGTHADGAAFNALLKTLEEPPPHVVFILATTDAHKVPATIVSRCQRIEFKRIPRAAIVGRLAHIAAEEGIAVPP